MPPSTLAPPPLVRLANENARADVATNTRQGTRDVKRDGREGNRQRVLLLLALLADRVAPDLVMTEVSESLDGKIDGVSADAASRGNHDVIVIAIVSCELRAACYER